MASPEEIMEDVEPQRRYHVSRNLVWGYMTEDKDLETNGILKNTAAHELYKHLKLKGLSQKEAIQRVTDGINGIKSESLTKEELTLLRDALFKGK